MPSITGIDLGTTNSVLAYLDESGEPRIQHNLEGENITPSAVSIDGTDVIVGSEALSLRDAGNEGVFTEFKRDMGTDISYSLPDGSEVTPQELSSMVLKKMVRDSKDSLGAISNTIITVPANEGNPMREHTRAAGNLADLPLGPVINEPSAAALYFSFTQNLKPGKYAVYDFGGGTWDISIVNVDGMKIDALDSSGIKKCGGKDLDDRLSELVNDIFEKQTGVPIDPNVPQTFRYEELKKSLSVSKERTISVRKEDLTPVSVVVTRADFENQISGLVAQTEMVCEQMFQKHNDVIDVLLAGGSTRVPLIKESIEKVFGKPPKTLDNPDEVIAKGAALYSGIKAVSSDLNAAQKERVDAVSFNEITNHYFGIEALLTNEITQKIEVKPSYIIEKNQSIPCSITRPYYTMSDGQIGVDLKIIQSDIAESEMQFVTVIWEGALDLDGPTPKGEQIDVTYSYKDGEEMTCSFVHVKTGRRTDVDLKPKSQLPDSKRQDMELFVIE